MRVALTKPELLKTLAKARAYSERDWLLCVTAFWHGLRASEVIYLRSENIRGDYLVVKRGKNSRKTEQLMYHRPKEPAA